MLLLLNVIMEHYLLLWWCGYGLMHTGQTDIAFDTVQIIISLWYFRAPVGRNNLGVVHTGQIYITFDTIQFIISLQYCVIVKQWEGEGGGANRPWCDAHWTDRRNDFDVVYTPKIDRHIRFSIIITSWC